MKIRISSIMDTKRKKAGVVVLCMALVGTIITGATIAAAAEKEQTNGPESKNVTFAEEKAYSETPESKAEAFAVYEQYGLTYNKSTDQLIYNRELVRYFEDYYPFGDGGSAGKDYFNENGTIDVHGVRDLSQLTHNSDGSFDPSGKLIGVEPYNQADFDARDIEELKNPPQTYAVSTGDTISPEELAKLYAVYKPFGLTYDKKQDCFYYNGKLVLQFIDVLASNGESFSSGKFKGAVRQMGDPDGEIEIKAVRDYTKLDANGYGALIGIEVVK